VNAQPALAAPMHPCHHGCRALSSLQLMLRDGDSRSQLVYIAVSGFGSRYRDRTDSLIFRQWVGTKPDRGETPPHQEELTPRKTEEPE
jgi:hypothetical protein